MNPPRPLTQSRLDQIYAQYKNNPLRLPKLEFNDGYFEQPWYDMAEYVTALRDEELIIIENCVGALPDLQRFKKMRDLRITDCAFLRPIEHDFPDWILQLVISKTNLQSLPNMPKLSDSVKIESTDLRSLPPLHKCEYLGYLAVGNNRYLTNLPPLPPRLEYLSFTRSGIMTIPPLPETLYILRFHDNLVEDLPWIPKQVRYVECDSNPLTHMPKEVILLEPNHRGIRVCSLPAVRQLQRFRELFYILKMGRHFKRILWRIRERIAIEMFNTTDLLRFMRNVPPHMTDLATDLLQSGKYGFGELADRLERVVEDCDLNARIERLLKGLLHN